MNEFNVCSPHNKSSLMIIDLFVCLLLAALHVIYHFILLCRHNVNIKLKGIKGEALEELRC